MSSKSKPLTQSELTDLEAKRDLAAELLQSVREMKAGHVRVVTSPVIEARKKTGLSQPQFAALIGVSVRTLARLGARPQAAKRRRPHFVGYREHESAGCACGCRPLEGLVIPP